MGKDADRIHHMSELGRGEGAAYTGTPYYQHAADYKKDKWIRKKQALQRRYVPMLLAIKHPLWSEEHIHGIYRRFENRRGGLEPLVSGCGSSNKLDAFHRFLLEAEKFAQKLDLTSQEQVVSLAKGRRNMGPEVD